MNIKKIISQLIVLVLLFSHTSIKTYASLPYVTGVTTESLDHGVKLFINGRTGSPTSYMIKRSDTKTGNYKVIVDNLTELSYEDTGLENAKTYFYKVIAKNEDGIGKDSDIIEGIPSKTNFLWLEVYGHRSYLYGIDVFDTDGNKVLYSSHYYYDQTGYKNNQYAGKLLLHGACLLNNNSWNNNIAPMTRIGLKLKPHKGIKKISIYSKEHAPIKADIYETIDDDNCNKLNQTSVLFESSDNNNVKEYEIFKSGLKAQGIDRKVMLNWDSIEGVKTYAIQRAEDKSGPFITIENELNKTQYEDNNLENNKMYYYKVQGSTNNGNIIDLGTVKANTTKDRYVIFELYESYDQNELYINELEILDNKNNKINYFVDDFATFNTPISVVKNINHLAGHYRELDYAKDGNIFNDNYQHYVRLSLYLHNGEWVRYVLKLDSNTGVDKINFWAGTDKQPKKVTFYTSLSYDYKDNLVLRRNDNLAFFSEKDIADTDEVVKYEFTQTSPNTPQGVNAISQDTRVNIKWNKVDNADSYKIKRSTSPSGPYTVIQEDVVDLQYTDTGVINGTEYYYVVSAINKGGESNNSLEASVIPSAKLPQAPTGLTVKSQQNGINLSWNPIYNANSYTIKRYETAGGPYETILENTTDTTFSDSGLTFGTTYYYVITANNTIGISNNSEEVQGTPGQILPEKPINIITKVKENNVYLTWDTANHAVSYNVMRSEAEDGTYNIMENVKGISYKDVTAESDKTYFYKIIAVNEQGESETSEQVRVVVKDNIEQKILLSLTMKNGSTKEYVITHSQLVKFMSWYQDNSIKKGLPYFTLIAKNRYGAYKSSKKYILFDSIMAIDVKEVQSN
ncbi:fibronectin type III domain-containing protein [Vallitalea guaymasensis]|uniref:fibronectin type III domain-containing protein n=1 Tax=Vallitalea guaymasensis TaxID=1185412 RepID=UPI002353CB97|nr:hypothetical protein [Vallitalea guaymasensis]